MYSRQLCGIRRRAVEEILAPVLPMGLREYSTDEVLEFREERFKGLFDKKGNRTRELTQAETQFVINEQALSKIDYRYFGERYWTVNLAGQTLGPLFPLWESQTLILDQIADIEWEHFQRDYPDGVIADVLKARQLGASTLIESMIGHRLITHGNVAGLLASDVPDNSNFLYDMFERGIDHLPWYLRPSILERVKNDEMVFGTGSRLMMGASKSTRGADKSETGSGGAGKKGQLGRGKTVSIVHLCVSPRTLIQVGTGLKPMNEVAAGDTVITHTGTTAAIKHIWRSPRRDELTADIWTWGTFAPLSTTRDHKILTPTGWIEAKNIREGDWVVQPVRQITHDLRNFTAYTRSLGGPSATRTLLPVVRPLSREWGYVFGLYLAEGSIQRSVTRRNPDVQAVGVCWSVDKDEAEDVVERLTAVGLRVGKVRKNAHSRTRVVPISQSGLTRWILGEFGEKDTKHVPLWVWEAGRDFCLGLVDGYLAGDGHYVPGSNEIYASSIRVALPVQMRALIASLGCGWSGIHYKSAGVYYERNCQAQWTLVISGETGRQFRSLVKQPTVAADVPYHWKWTDDGHIAAEVYRIHDGWSEEFYDLEVESVDHSFTGVAGALHNSELATWTNPNQIDSALDPGIPRSPFTFWIKESTAQGRGPHNWWYMDWQTAKAGRSRSRAIFIPWYAEKEKYWLPCPGGWVPNADTLSHARRIEETSPRWFRGKVYRPTREQLFWYESTRGEKDSKGLLEEFLQEYPADDEEAFQMSGRSVFKVQVRERVRTQARPLSGLVEIQSHREMGLG